MKIINQMNFFQIYSEKRDENPGCVGDLVFRNKNKIH